MRCVKKIRTFVIRGRGLQIWIERDWIQTTAGVIYGNSAFGKKNRV